MTKFKMVPACFLVSALAFSGSVQALEADLGAGFVAEVSFRSAVDGAVTTGIRAIPLSAEDLGGYGSDKFLGEETAGILSKVNAKLRESVPGVQPFFPWAAKMKFGVTHDILMFGEGKSKIAATFRLKSLFPAKFLSEHDDATIAESPQAKDAVKNVFKVLGEAFMVEQPLRVSVVLPYVGSLDMGPGSGLAYEKLPMVDPDTLDGSIHTASGLADQPLFTTYWTWGGARPDVVGNNTGITWGVALWEDSIHLAAHIVPVTKFNFSLAAEKAGDTGDDGTTAGAGYVQGTRGSFGGAIGFQRNFGKVKLKFATGYHTDMPYKMVTGPETLPSKSEYFLVNRAKFAGALIGVHYDAGDIGTFMATFNYGYSSEGSNYKEGKLAFGDRLHDFKTSLAWRSANWVAMVSANLVATVKIADKVDGAPVRVDPNSETSAIVGYKIGSMKNPWAIMFDLSASMLLGYSSRAFIGTRIGIDRGVFNINHSEPDPTEFTKSSAGEITVKKLSKKDIWYFNFNFGLEYFF